MISGRKIPRKEILYLEDRIREEGGFQPRGCGCIIAFPLRVHRFKYGATRGIQGCNVPVLSRQGS